MNISADKFDVSILIATYNRAEILRQTLVAMTNVDRDGIKTEIVVVDNNSSDNTKEVIESFTSSLTIRYLFESQAGKNKALNHALNTVKLGEIVVFCDDDIVPSRQWLTAIVESCQRWPQYSVFGGKNYLVWPDTHIPEWAECPDIHGWAFSRHDNIGDKDTPYPSGGHPSGANFWVRSSIFDDGRRYDESIGPKAGGNFFMGSETSFLFQLARDGYPAIYIPEGVVGHRVQPELFDPQTIKKRARRHGGGFYHLRPLPRRQLLQKHPVLWRLVQILVLAKWYLYYAFSMFTLSADRRLLKQLVAIRWIACNKESFNVATGEQLENMPSEPDEKAPEITVQFVPYWGGNPYQNQLSEHLADRGVRMEKGDSLKSAFRRYVFKGQRFNVLHVHWLPAVVKPYFLSFLRVVIFMVRLFVLRLFGVKVVWTVHNIKSHEGKYQSLDQWVRRTIANMADALITHTQAAKDQIVYQWNLHHPKKVFVVPHGNYIQSYKNTTTRADARRQLQLQDDVFVVLFLGGVRPYKGVPELIKSFKVLGNDNACLLIAGKAVNESYADQIKEQIGDDAQIRWDSGFIEDDNIQDYMAACDVVAFPYREVFSSGAVVLAMSFARPCITPLTATIQEVLDTSGAFLYDAGSEDGLQNAMRQAIENRHRLTQMGEHNLQLARQWDWESIAQRTVDIYEWCLTPAEERASAIAPLHSRQTVKGNLS